MLEDKVSVLFHQAQERDKKKMWDKRQGSWDHFNNIRRKEDIEGEIINEIIKENLPNLKDRIIQIENPFSRLRPRARTGCTASKFHAP